MAKFFGKVGYVETVESDTQPGVWEEVVTERPYYGDVIKNTRRLESGESLNDNITVSNTISILADAYAYQHFFAIRYVEWMGTTWKVSNVEVERPRLTLTVGGLYNAPES